MRLLFRHQDGQSEQVQIPQQCTPTGGMQRLLGAREPRRTQASALTLTAFLPLTHSVLPRVTVCLSVIEELAMQFRALHSRTAALSLSTASSWRSTYYRTWMISGTFFPKIKISATFGLRISAIFFLGWAGCFSIVVCAISISQYMYTH